MDQPSPLQMAMAIIVGIFDEHASKSGDKTTLSKAEVKDLVQTHFKEILGNADDPKQLDEIFQKLDQNSDNAVDFTEFMTTVAAITSILYEVMKVQKQ